MSRVRREVRLEMTLRLSIDVDVHASTVEAERAAEDWMRRFILPQKAPENIVQEVVWLKAKAGEAG